MLSYDDLFSGMEELEEEAASEEESEEGEERAPESAPAQEQRKWSVRISAAVAVSLPLLLATSVNNGCFQVSLIL